MEFLKKVTQRLLQVRTTARLMAEDGLINTTDLLVATGATVILAAGVGAAVIGTLDDAKYGKAQPDGQAITTAISQFYRDTGKWPGQAEAAAADDGTMPTLLASTTEVEFLPKDYMSALLTSAATCKPNSLEGFVGVEIGASAAAEDAFSDATILNLNNYLVRQPSTVNYPNWQGPYLQADIKTDPWDRAWVANLQPLYCSELITGTTAANAAGDLGYAWLLSGGSNRTISTKFKDANLDPTGDDAGVNMGKLTTRANGGLDAN
jgi:hypothetical protein